MRVLVVEDDPRMAELIVGIIGRAGFVADTVPGIQDADHALEFLPYDAAVLDLSLVDGDGLTLLARLRARRSGLPVLVLTARDTLDDRVAGLDAGADDYLVKPFAGTELVARLKALLRRPGHSLGVLLEAGTLTFDTIGREARVDGTALPLARQELAILEHLLRRNGRVVPKVLLEEKLYGDGGELESNAIPVHVHHLRKKLADANAGCTIHTVRGVGYFLTDGITA
ncbi:response regulator [Sphingomonas sp. PAMC 26617]|uniref:response regulator n=1 Tax=Sphingomonas sp. PAMC 26617 TaxID=1112216 RepID=UPI00028A0345|nr:response regulator transcription factor [Sphingomonas sp. PAMC 26617]